MPGRLPPPGASACPRLSPRPEYGPAWHYLMRAAVRLLRFPLLCTVFHILTERGYAKAYVRFASLMPHTPFRMWWAQPDDLFFTIGLSLSISVVWLLENGFFMLCDRYSLLQQYKLRRVPSMQPSASLVRTTLLNSALSHLIIGPALMLLVVGPALRHLALARALPSPVLPETLPSWTTTWLNFTVAFFINEVIFYFGHRLLHWKPLYRTIHKQHHSYVGTRSFAAEYAHPVEDVLTAYIPFLLGIVLMNAHFHFVFCWFFCKLTETYESHSGYCFAGSWLHWFGLTNSSIAAHHDFHHTRNQGNFGWEILDYLCGTMDEWVRLGGRDGYISQLRAKAGDK
ncbi:hypothetical protein AB1Y20_013097 [Prymnesium parvum]|uniref:Fatty acid hydroxylase domain-containing protein n=1 Tax=Prymnesium parvum TaxID=97485 RepID=A0AB34IKJ7_PRYPA